jgi:hypothetical protein
VKNAAETKSPEIMPGGVRLDDLLPKFSLNQTDPKLFYHEEEEHQERSDANGTVRHTRRKRTLGARGPAALVATVLIAIAIIALSLMMGSFRQ